MKLVSLDELGRLPKIGERVMIVSERSTDSVGKSRWNYKGLMDRHLSTVMTIRDICEESWRGASFRAKMEEDAGEFLGDGWSWYPEMIVGVFVEDGPLDDDTSLWETQSLASLLM